MSTKNTTLISQNDTIMLMTNKWEGKALLIIISHGLIEEEKI